MKTLLALLVVSLGLVVSTFAQSAEVRAALEELAQQKSPSGANARAMLANPIQPGESRAAWEDRLARAVRIEAKTWTRDDEAAYSTRYAARVAAEAQARRDAEIAEAINRNARALENLRR